MIERIKTDSIPVIKYYDTQWIYSNNEICKRFSQSNKNNEKKTTDFTLPQMAEMNSST
jgi:hypothetical protein